MIQNPKPVEFARTPHGRSKTARTVSAKQKNTDNDHQSNQDCPLLLVKTPNVPGQLMAKHLNAVKHVSLLLESGASKLKHRSSLTAGSQTWEFDELRDYKQETPFDCRTCEPAAEGYNSLENDQAKGP